LTRALAADHSPDGISCERRRPCPIFTPFHQRRIAAARRDREQYMPRPPQGTMLKRPGRAEEVAAAILFLAPTMPPTSRRPAVRDGGIAL